MRKPFERIGVFGLGYIGLPTAALLATRGFRVCGVDVNEHAVATINAGRIHLREPDLDVLVHSAVQSGRLTAAQTPEPADAFILAVPTPFRAGHVPDLRCVEAAADALAPCLKPGNLVILESTCPVGTTEALAKRLQQRRPNLSFPRRQDGKNSAQRRGQVFVAHCPERVLPGRILRELVDNDRVVGGLDRASAEKAATLYRSFVSGRIFLTDARTAEMCKLTENAFRDVNIAFANELSLLCDRLNVNVWELIELANRHPRVKILRPGPGVGGHCIAVDPWFLVHASPKTARLLRTAREVNDFKPQHVIAQIKRAAKNYKKPIIACLGLAFKADVDDLRESPSVKIVAALAKAKVGEILAVEPNVAKLPRELENDRVVLCDLTTALKKADVVALLTDHREFRELDRKKTAHKTIVDARGIWRDQKEK